MNNDLKTRFPILFDFFTSKKVDNTFLKALEYYSDYYLNVEAGLSDMSITQRVNCLNNINFTKDKTEHKPIDKKINRGYAQAYAGFNEVLAYKFLVEYGCTDVQFIPRKKGIQTPDLKGKLKDKDVILEAKVIHNSDNETAHILDSIKRPIARTVDTNHKALIKKLKATIEAAMIQINSYIQVEDCIKIIFIQINPDLGVLLGSITDDVFEQELKLLQDSYRNNNIEVVITISK